MRRQICVIWSANQAHVTFPGKVVTTWNQYVQEDAYIDKVSKDGFVNDAVFFHC